MLTYADVCAGKNARHQLLVHDGLTSYLRLLSVKYWDHVALNSIAAWVCAAGSEKVEELLVLPQSITHIMTCLAQAHRGSASNCSRRRRMLTYADVC